MINKECAGFFVAPYGIDGEQAGLGFWAVSKLSAKWLEVCTKLLETQGAVFDVSWGGNLNDFRTTFTSTAGAAIATFFVRDRVASSILLLRGQSENVERSVTDMFLQSLRRTALVQQATNNPQSFSGVSTVRERPLMVVVAWCDALISGQEHDVVRELGLHLGAVFLLNEAR